MLTKTVSDSTGGDPSRTTSSTYNTHGQLARTTDPMGNVTSDTYDSMGNLATTTNPSGVVTAFTYDADGKALTTTVDGYTGNPSAPIPAENLVTNSRAYDPAGRLASVTNVGGTTTDYTYYDDNRLAASYVVGSGGTKTHRHHLRLRRGRQPGHARPARRPGHDTPLTTPTTRSSRQTEDPSGVDRVVTAKYDATGDVISDRAASPAARPRRRPRLTTPWASSCRRPSTWAAAVATSPRRPPGISADTSFRRPIQWATRPYPERRRRPPGRRDDPAVLG